MKRRRFLASALGVVAGTQIPKVIGATPPPISSSGSRAPSWFNVLNYGAIGSGGSNPASGYYGSLAALQAVYSFATATTNEMDWLAFQAAINAVNSAGGGVVYVPNKTFIFTNANSTTDGSGMLMLPEIAPYSGGAVSIMGDIAGGSAMEWPNDLGKPAAASFTGVISSTTLTTSSVTGTIRPYFYVNGVSVTAGTIITQQLTGAVGGAGTYRVNNSQSISSEAMTASLAAKSNPSGYAGAIFCGDHANSYSAESYGVLQDLYIGGPGAGGTLGASSAVMMGIMTGDRRALVRVAADGFYAGVHVIGGQTRWQECYFNYNYYGAYWDEPSQAFGDMQFDRIDFSNNNMAGIGCCNGHAAPVTSLFNKCIFDAQPYAIFKESTGIGYTGANNGNVLYDDEFIECQFENIGNALLGDGLPSGATFTGSISGTTLTVASFSSGSGNLRTGHTITGSGISGVYWITGQLTGSAGDTGTYSLNATPGTIGSETLTASRVSFIWNTKFSGCEFIWNLAFNIAALPQTGIFECYQALGLLIEHPIITFGWTPGTAGLFDIIQLVNSPTGNWTPSEIFKISGDISTLIANCGNAGKAFFGTQSYVGPGAALLDNQGFWQGEATYATGFSSTAGGSIVLGNLSAATLSAGSSSDNVQGILILNGVQGIVVKSGVISVASGSNVITAGAAVYSGASGQATASTGGQKIGYAVTANSGGYTAVRLQGLQ